MMQLQPLESFSARLKLIERRLEAAASETQYDFFVDFIKNILNDMNLHDACYEWKLNKFGVTVPSLRISPILRISVRSGIDTSKVATVHIKEDELRINYSYGVIGKVINIIDPWTCTMSDLTDATQRPVKVDKLITFLVRCLNLRDF